MQQLTATSSSSPLCTTTLLTCAAFTPAQRTRLLASSPLQNDSLGPHGEDSHRHSPLSRRLVTLGAPFWARDSTITRRVHRMSRPGSREPVNGSILTRKAHHAMDALQALQLQDSHPAAAGCPAKGSNTRHDEAVEEAACRAPQS